jgi:uncharacterized membrane protein YfcA
MTLDLVSTIVLLAGAFAGALVSSFAGFAFAPVAGAVLLTAFTPRAVVPVLMLSSVIVQTATLVYLRRSLAFRSIGTMLIGGALGVPLAVVAFHQIDAHAFRIGFGLFLSAYALVMLVRPCFRVRIASARRDEIVVGFFGGLVGGLTAMPGAVPVLYCDCRGVGKEEQRATVQPFILAMQMLALVLMGLHGDIDGHVVGLVTLALPALATGVAAGLVLFGRAPDAGFRRAVLALLLVTGLVLAAQPKPSTAADSGRSSTSASTVASVSSEDAFDPGPVPTCDRTGTC